MLPVAGPLPSRCWNVCGKIRGWTPCTYASITDDAGNDACERMTETLEEMNLEVQRLCPQRKDWNDDLCAKFEKKEKAT